MAVCGEHDIVGILANYIVITFMLVRFCSPAPMQDWQAQKQLYVSILYILAAGLVAPLLVIPQRTWLCCSLQECINRLCKSSRDKGSSRSRQICTELAYFTWDVGCSKKKPLLKWLWTRIPSFVRVKHERCSTKLSAASGCEGLP